MERREQILAVVVVALLLIGLFAFLIYVLTVGTTNGHMTIRVGFHDAQEIDTDVWSIEVANVTGYHELEHENTNQFSVSLLKEDSVVIPITELRNGFVVGANNTYIFFGDNGQIGRLDAGDIFYFAGLESASDYEFRLIFTLSAEIVGRVSIIT
ncbi:MAG: hypothetical protein JSV43_01715 [Methanobacteriota archaeon]|nr:MAG: hypothetical protein JSV43_01715 [Euryarchaeota archaeon]